MNIIQKIEPFILQDIIVTADIPSTIPYWAHWAHWAHWGAVSLIILLIMWAVLPILVKK